MNRRFWLALLLMAPGVLVGASIAASPDPAGGWSYPLGQRLLYVHVPMAWVAYAGFLAAAVTAGLLLARGPGLSGRLLRSLTEVTCVYAATALATGLAWSYEFALYDPLADPKVLTTLVLVATLAGLWALAASTPPGRRHELLAGLTLVGVVTVPASYLASRLASPHPDFTRPEQTLDPAMALPLVIASVGFLLLFMGIVIVRTRMLGAEEGSPW